MGRRAIMKLLLDTHVVLWSLLEPARLSTQVAAALESPANELWVSPISTWEVLVLAEKGRIRLYSDPVTWMRRVYGAVPWQQAPLNHEVAIASRTIGLHSASAGDAAAGGVPSRWRRRCRTRPSGTG